MTLIFSPGAFLCRDPTTRSRSGPNSSPPPERIDTLTFRSWVPGATPVKVRV